jgi:hypothetical protein
LLGQDIANNVISVLYNKQLLIFWHNSKHLKQGILKNLCSKRVIAIPFQRYLNFLTAVSKEVHANSQSAKLPELYLSQTSQHE